jgi:hypothetical protein
MPKLIRIVSDVLRIVSAVVLVGVAAFCVFGLSEPDVTNSVALLFGAVGLSSVGAAGYLVWPMIRQRERNAMSIRSKQLVILFTVLRIVSAVVLVGVAAFCVFGFLASSEAGPEDANLFRLLYGAVGLSSVVTAGYLVTSIRSKKLVILCLLIYAALVCLATACVLVAGNVEEGRALPAVVLTLPWGLIATYLFETYGALAFAAWIVITANVIDSCILLLSLKSFPSSLSGWFPS